MSKKVDTDELLHRAWRALMVPTNKGDISTNHSEPPKKEARRNKET